MLEKAKAARAAGDREAERAALREAVFQVCVARFLSGWTGHPLRAPKSKGFVDEALAFADEASDDLNLAFERLIPDFALLLDDALTEAKQELGAKASNVESDGDGLAPLMLGWQASLIVDLASEAMRSGADGRLGALERVRLADFDEPDSGMVAVDAGRVYFGCEGCGAEREEPLGEVGTARACACGAVALVPRVPLARMAAYLKAERDAARGIARCKVCKGIIQLGRKGAMRAGFCGVYCARKGMELFREYVAREGSWEGELIVYVCDCGRSDRAKLEEVGTKRPCADCGLEVWIPDAGTPPRKGVAPCPGCGRPRKTTAPRCMYCGR